MWTWQGRHSSERGPRVGTGVESPKNGSAFRCSIAERKIREVLAVSVFFFWRESHRKSKTILHSYDKKFRRMALVLRLAYPDCHNAFKVGASVYTLEDTIVTPYPHSSI